MLPRIVITILLAGLSLSCGGGTPTAATPPSSAPPVVQTIVELLVPNPVQTQAIELAQSVTLPPGTFNTIRFRWILGPAAPPLAGSLYILGQEYLGRVSELSTAPGLVARSIRIENGEYLFDSAITLAGGTKYWFAADSPVGYQASQSTSDIYPGGDLYGMTGERAFGRLYITSPDNRLDASFTLRGVRVP